MSLDECSIHANGQCPTCVNVDNNVTVAATCITCNQTMSNKTLNNWQQGVTPPATSNDLFLQCPYGSYMDGRIAKWWMPDDVVFVEEIPHTATGKIQKVRLREQFKDHRLPTVDAVQ